MNSTDEELVSLAQSGNEEAMNTLLKKYKALVNKIARSYFLVGGDMEDLVQEGMIGLYKSITHYHTDKSASFMTFAYTCIKRQIQTAIKVASSDKNKILSQALPIAEIFSKDEDEEFEQIIPSNLPSPDDKVLENEKLTEIYNKIKETLSDLEKKILVLYLRGYSYNEIAKLSGLGKKSIDNGLSRIKHKLSFLKKDTKN